MEIKKKVKGVALSQNSAEDLLKFLKEKRAEQNKIAENNLDKETIDNTSLEEMIAVSKKISE